MNLRGLCFLVVGVLLAGAGEPTAAPPPSKKETADDKKPLKLPEWWDAKDPLPQKKSNCVRCHLTAGRELTAPLRDFALSAHDRAKLSCNDCHGGDIKDDAKAHEQDSHFIGTKLSAHVEACSECHKSQADGFRKSKHYWDLSRRVNRDYPMCVDCHGHHDIGKPPAEFALANVCSDCHKKLDKEQPGAASVVAENDRLWQTLRQVHAKSKAVEEPVPAQFRRKVERTRKATSRLIHAARPIPEEEAKTHNQRVNDLRQELEGWLKARKSDSSARLDALAKLKPDKLEAVHQAILDLRSEWKKLDRPGPYRDFRANLHVHSGLSHDSRGTIDEIVKAAKTAGTKILMFTEHPADHYDFYADGHRGIKDGVLLIPGAESKGFLAFPTHSLRGLTTGSPQEFCDLVRRRNGLVFLSHLEERMDWDIRGMTGTEIYNTHADFKDEKRLIAAMRNPLWIFGAVDLFRKYPQEAFSALQDYPADYLRRWDQFQTPHTGVAANDSHQNVGFLIRLLDKDKVRLEDALGKKLFELEANKIQVLQSLRKEKKPGDVIFRIQLDPYEYSLRHVGTHLLLKEQTEKAVWEALEVGRAFVSFDWLADATGFDYAAQVAGRRHEMGSTLPFDKDLTLDGQAPLPGHWKVVRDGKVIAETTGRTCKYTISEPGKYRVEVWLHIAGEDMTWILSNPIYIKPSE